MRAGWSRKCLRQHDILNHDLAVAKCMERWMEVKENLKMAENDCRFRVSQRWRMKEEELHFLYWILINLNFPLLLGGPTDIVYIIYT